jgi:hypothetical protein
MLKIVKVIKIDKKTRKRYDLMESKTSKNASKKNVLRKL